MCWAYALLLADTNLGLDPEEIVLEKVAANRVEVPGGKGGQRGGHEVHGLASAVGHARLHRTRWPGFLADVDGQRRSTSKVQASRCGSGCRCGVGGQRAVRAGATASFACGHDAHDGRSTVPEDAGVSIECQLPMSSKRIDFILCAATTPTASRTSGHRGAEAMERGVGERATTGWSKRGWAAASATTAHPSYQAWSYAAYLARVQRSLVETLEESSCSRARSCTTARTGRPCSTSAPLQPSTRCRAPVFLKQNRRRDAAWVSLSYFVQTAWRQRGVLMVTIDHGRIRPS